MRMNAPSREGFASVGRTRLFLSGLCFALALAAGLAFLPASFDARGARRQGQLVAEVRFVNVTLARTALEDRITSAVAQQRFLMDHLVLDRDAPLDDVQRSLLGSIYNTPDVLGYYLLPLPNQPQRRFSAFRSTPQGDAARDFARILAYKLEEDATPFVEGRQQTRRFMPSSRVNMLALVETAPGRSVTWHSIAVLNLAPFLARFVEPLETSAEGGFFVVASDGTIIAHKDGTLVGKNVEDLSSGEGEGLREFWGRASQAFSGMEVVEAPLSSLIGSERKSIVWNSLRMGDERVFIGSYAPAEGGGAASSEPGALSRPLSVVLPFLLVLAGILVLTAGRRPGGGERGLSRVPSLDDAPVAAALLDVKGAVLYSNEALVAMTGRTREQLRMRTIFDLAGETPREEKDRVREALRVGARSSGFEMLFSNREADPSPAADSFWGLVSLSSPGDGFPAGSMLALVSDISELRQARLTLRHNAEALDAGKSELEHLAASQAAFLNMLTRFSECSSIEELFDVLSEHMMPIIQFRCLTLYIRSSRDSSFSVIDTGGDVVQSNQTDFLDNKKGVLGHVAETGKPYLMGDASVDPYFIPHSREVQSAVFAPALYKDFLWGALILDSERKFAFAARDRDMLSIVASYVALHAEEFSVRRELDKKAVQLRFLHGVVQKIAAERDNETLASNIVDVLCDELHFPDARFYTPAPKGGGAPVQAAGRASSDCAECARGFELEASAAMRSRTLVERMENGKVMVLAVPLVFENEVFGALAARHGAGFSASDRELLEITAEHMTTFWALNNLIAKRRHESLVDPLTQVWNRRYIMQRLNEESSRISRTSGRGAVVLVDLGDFKMINDRYGHMVGDEVLRVTSETMSKNLRDYDMIGRYGGDEFLVYLPDASRQGAEAIMDRMEKEVGRQIIDGFDGAVILDYGIAVCPEDGPVISDVVRIADMRMYKNKERRKAGLAR